MPLLSGFWPLMIWVGVVSSVTPHPEWSPPSVPLKHTRIQTTAMTHHSNNSVRDHMKWVSGSLFISRINIMVLVCIPSSWCQCISLLLPSLGSLSFPGLLVSVRSPCEESLWGVPVRSPRRPRPPSFCSDMLFVLPGWVAGLRGGAVQHGPDASQQHPGPEEDDVIPGSRAQGQSREPPNPLAAQPQSPWTPGSARTSPPQPHGASLSRQLSPPGKREKTQKAC